MSKRYDQSIILFSAENGSTTVGTGFAFHDQYVFSCTHVVSKALDLKENEQVLPGRRLKADIALHNQCEIDLEVVHSIPLKENPLADDIEDITILKLVGGQASLVFADLYQKDDELDYKNQSITFFGFNKPDGDWHKGTSKGPNRSGRIQLEVENRARDSLSGLSGAPVWCDKFNAIVGMLVEKWKSNLDAYMIPAKKLHEALESVPECILAEPIISGDSVSFQKEIQAHIAGELVNEDIAKFKELLTDELNKLLKTSEENSITSDQDIAQNLIAALKIGSTGVPVITKVLMNATLDCLDRRKGKFYRENQGKHEAIKDAVEQILGWLIVASVNDHNLRDLKPSFKSSSMYFELPVLTSAGVEIIVARHTERRAYLEARESLSGTYVLEIGAGTFNWKEDNIATDLMIKIWNHVFPGRQKQNSTKKLSEKEIGELNSELEIRRASDFDKEHHILAIESDRKNMNHKAYEELLESLDQLTLVCYGFEEQQIFCSLEQRLVAAIGYFLKKINKAS